MYIEYLEFGGFNDGDIPRYFIFELENSEPTQFAVPEVNKSLLDDQMVLSTMLKKNLILWMRQRIMYCQKVSCIQILNRIYC